MSEPLDIKTRQLLAGVFSRHPGIEQAILYGYRAKGTHHTRSDIDISLKGALLDRFDMGAVQMDLDDLDISWQVDVQHYEELLNPALREHIDRDGVIIWTQ
jgi:predicted nucleotidyltransferase